MPGSSAPTSTCVPSGARVATASKPTPVTSSNLFRPTWSAGRTWRSPSCPTSPRPRWSLLPRDTLTFEDTAHYDGGPDGTRLLQTGRHRGPAFLRPGGVLLLEVGGAQADVLRPVVERLGYVSVETWADADGDLRGLQATRS